MLVQRFLRQPGHPQVDSAQSPVPTMAHHVLHVARDDRLPVLVDLASAPGRTPGLHPHQARRQGADPPAQPQRGARPSSCTATSARTPAPATWTRSPTARRSTLVATDIAARGIHVDDVALVIHADPPVEHKAYLHRSGRTARAGAEGTVVTLMTDEQVGDVRDLTRAAGIKARDHPARRAGHPLLAELAPGRAGQGARRHRRRGSGRW